MKLNEIVGTLSRQKNSKKVARKKFKMTFKKYKMKGRTLCSKFPLAGLDLSSFISFCKKWTLSLRSVVWRKKVTVRVGLFYKENAPTEIATIKWPLDVLSIHAN